VAVDDCFREIKTAIFEVDLDAFTALCNQVSDCDFDAADYEPYAWGFLLKKNNTTACNMFGGAMYAFI
jgi:hypothetical protein